MAAAAIPISNLYPISQPEQVPEKELEYKPEKEQENTNIQNKTKLDFEYKNINAFSESNILEFFKSKYIEHQEIIKKNIANKGTIREINVAFRETVKLSNGQTTFIRKIKNFYNLYSMDSNWIKPENIGEFWKSFMTLKTQNIKRTQKLIINRLNPNINMKVVDINKNVGDILETFKNILNDSYNVDVDNKFKIVNTLLPSIKSEDKEKKEIFLSNYTFDSNQYEDTKMKLFLKAVMPIDQYFSRDVIKNIFEKEINAFLEITNKNFSIIDIDNNISSQISLICYRDIKQPLLVVPYGILILFTSLNDDNINDNDGYFLFEPLYVEMENITNLEYVDRCGASLYNNTSYLNVMRCLNTNITQMGVKLAAESKTGRVVRSGNTLEFKEVDCSGFGKEPDNICTYNGELKYLGYRKNKHCTMDIKEDIADKNILMYIKLFIQNSIFRNLPFQLIINIDAEILSKLTRIAVSELPELSIFKIDHEHGYLFKCYQMTTDQENKKLIFINKYVLKGKIMISEFKDFLKSYQKIFFIITPKKYLIISSDSIDPPFSIDSFKNINKLLSFDDIEKISKEKSEFHFYNIIRSYSDSYNIFISSNLSKSILLNAMVAQNIYDNIKRLGKNILYETEVYNFDYIYNLQVKYFISYHITNLRKNCAKYHGNSKTFTDMLDIFNHLKSLFKPSSELYRVFNDALFCRNKLLEYVIGNINPEIYTKKHYQSNNAITSNSTAGGFRKKTKLKKVKKNNPHTAVNNYNSRSNFVSDFIIKT